MRQLDSTVGWRVQRVPGGLHYIDPMGVAYRACPVEHADLVVQYRWGQVGLRYVDRKRAPQGDLRIDLIGVSVLPKPVPTPAPRRRGR